MVPVDVKRSMGAAKNSSRSPLPDAMKIGVIQISVRQSRQLPRQMSTIKKIRKFFFSIFSNFLLILWVYRMIIYNVLNFGISTLFGLKVINVLNFDHVTST